MTTYRKILLATLLSSFAIANTACSTDTPTEPGTVVVTAGGSVQGLSPTSPVASAQPQQITVTGVNFTSATTLVLRGPDGSPTFYNSSTFSSLQTTSFSVGVVLATAGNWTANVRGADGVDSTQVNFNVVGDATTVMAPQITGISPSTASLSIGSQNITVSGMNFDSGASLTVRSPTGTITSYGTASLTGLTSTSFSVFITYSRAGTYDLVVTNSNGQQSAAAQLLVQ